MTIDLTECRAKIERAQEHRELLEAEVAPVLRGEAKRFKVSAEFDPELGYHILRLSEFPDAWVMRLGLILGDTVHNLRGALDYLYWQLYCRYVRIPTPQQYPEVKFPIEYTQQRLSNIRVHVRKIPNAQWTVICKAQPYYRSYNPLNIALGVLRELSNRDKHRTLTPMTIRTSTLSLPSNLRGLSKVRDLKPFASRQSLKVGTILLGVELPPGTDCYVEVAGHTTPRILLPQGQYTLMQGVDLMTDAVRNVIDGIEAEL